MSRNTIALYNAHVKPTQPPPACGDITAQELRRVAANMRHDASRMLARANDLDKLADRLEGK